MSQHSNNQPVRLTLDNQPSREGRYADIGESHREDDEVSGFEILETFERFNPHLSFGHRRHGHRQRLFP